MPRHVPPSIESILLSAQSTQSTQSTATLTNTIGTMDSGSPPQIPSPLPLDNMQDNRPPGGTRRSGGAKTPRKVQWHDERDVVPDANASTRALDEHGLDVSLSFPVLLVVFRGLPGHRLPFGVSQLPACPSLCVQFGCFLVVSPATCATC